jgi:hypothetical protein
MTMSLLLNSMSAAHPRFVENEIAVRIIALFERFPYGGGFPTEDLEERPPPGQPRAGPAGGAGAGAALPEIAVKELRFSPGVRAEDQAHLRQTLRAALAEFVAERPQAHMVLAGRTFNRRAHQLLDTRALRAQENRS